MNPAQKSSLIIIICLIIVITGLFLGVINPLSSRFLKIYQENATLNNRVSAIQKKIDYLEKTKKYEKQITQANQKFFDFVPKTSQVENVLVQLDALAKESTNTLPTFSVSENKDNKQSKGEFKTTGISIALSGTYESVRSFIYSLENLQRFAVINSLSISASDVEVSANINLTVYHRE